MHLKRIKIAGFKSFADPVTIHVPNSLSGIVGPNGSGKSNVIDAMRWVVGESSAKSLRGETLDDVIFNGSSERKPAARASVELLFDNSLNRCPGQWAKFGEISIRRTITRDGISEYFINNTRTRRRDVKELFLGTGFGPRSYSIIEQGMISRIVDGKPEELSSFIEEASGVSRFREKRHETHLKLNRTQENLERLDDMRTEVDSRLRQLKYQADQARRYTKLKENAQHLRARILSVEWGVMSQQIEKLDSVVSQLDIEKNRRMALVRSAEADLENARKGQLQLQSRLNQLQMESYRISAEISNLDRQIKESSEEFARDRQNLSLKNEEIAEIEKSILDLKRNESKAVEEFNSNQILLGEASENLREKMDVLVSLEARFENSQSELENLDKQVFEAIRRRESTLANLDALQRRQPDVDNRLAVLTAELNQLESETEIHSTEPLQTRIDELSGMSENLQNEIDGAESSLVKKRAECDHLIDDLERIRDSSQEAQIKLRTLERSLSEKQASESLVKWLDDNGLSDSPALSSQVKVADGWERAVDRVMGEKMSAVIVDNTEKLALSVNGSTLVSSMYFVDSSAVADESSDSSRGLARFVESTDHVVESMLCGVYAVDDLAEAFSMRSNLRGNEFIVTAQGSMLGANWYSPAIGDEAPAGVLETTNLIRKCREQVERDEVRQQTKRQQIEHARKSVAGLESTISHLRQQLSEKSGQVVTVRSELGEIHSSHIRSTERLEQVRNQVQQLIETRTSLENERRNLKEQAGIESSACAEIEQGKSAKSQQLKIQQIALKEHQDAVNEAVVAKHGIELEAQKHNSDRELFQSSIADQQQRLDAVRAEKDALEIKLSTTDDPTDSLKAKLGEFVVESQQCEKQLTQARSNSEESETGYRSLDETRLQHQLSVEEINTKVQDRKVEVSTLVVQVEELRQKIEELETTPEEQLSQVDDDFDQKASSRKLENLLRRIDNTGAINLIAVQQYEEEKQRKEYMDSQHDDLTRAVETLRATITKIDEESRERFNEMFNMVNSEYQRLLPLLFGGGSGHLELIGEYPESAGMRIYARPKGKRIHNIQALSGGEKALTAIALILSFFQLNPSPVCLLDEIDAPLDDENVYRLCESLRNLSDSTQLVLITHNKITMESVDALIGITMPEPNVSRILSVDLQEAQEFVA